MINVQCLEKANGLVVVVAGRLDAETSTRFAGLSAEVLERGSKNIVLDLSRLKYISSMGLRSILNLAKSVNAGGARFAVCGLQGMVAEVFEITGFASVLKTFETPEEALSDA